MIPPIVALVAVTLQYFDPPIGALLGPLIPNALAHDYRDAKWLFVPYVMKYDELRATSPYERRAPPSRGGANRILYRLRTGSNAVPQCLPEYPNRYTADHITIHHLLTHSAGPSDIFKP